MIQYFGMDVHTNYTAIAISLKDNVNDTYEVVDTISVNSAAADDIIKAIAPYMNPRPAIANPIQQTVMGYEAGCLGFSLQRDLTANGYNCVILAPSTMAVSPLGRSVFKNDKRDAKAIAKCLADHNYAKVFVPDIGDNAVGEYIRMRDDAQDFVVVIKQQICSFCHRHGFHYSAGAHWTAKHYKWLKSLTFEHEVLRENLNERLLLLEKLEEKVALYDQRIQEYSESKQYQEKVKKLGCFIGMGTNTALAFVTEIGDFSRFKSSAEFSSFIGLVPGEHSSNGNGPGMGITKAGNGHLRKMLILASQSMCRGSVGAKSRELKRRQKGMSEEVIDYADRGNERLRRRYYRLIQKGKCRNVAVTAVARELACFIWGMMNDHIDSKPASVRKKVKMA